MSNRSNLRITALAGGVGAAKLLRGVVRVLPSENLTAIVNTGDDDEFFGLAVSPDLDTISYTLANAVDATKGWGLPDETHRCLEGLGRYYSDTWFALGDTDLATHLYRSQQLRDGKTLSQITAAVAARWNVQATVLPMTNDPVRTVVSTETGTWTFQEYFVKMRGEGTVLDIEIQGIDKAKPGPGVLDAILNADLVLLPPSNPIVSIGPILKLNGVRDALRLTKAPVVAVSPLVAGKPIKGPADRMLSGLGFEVSSVGVAGLYRDFVNTFVFDQEDLKEDGTADQRIKQMHMETIVTDTVMTNMSKSVALAKQIIDFRHQKREKPNSEERI